MKADEDLKSCVSQEPAFLFSYTDRAGGSLSYLEEQEGPQVCCVCLTGKNVLLEANTDSTTMGVN